MELTYDRVKDFCPKCIYCEKIYLNKELLAHHFLVHHLLNKTKSFWCPHCITFEKNILSHVQKKHETLCLFCGKYEQKEFHQQCTMLVKNAIRQYFQKKISCLLNMLEGLEDIKEVKMINLS